MVDLPRDAHGTEWGGRPATVEIVPALRRTLLGLVAIGVVVAIGTMATGLALARDYRPRSEAVGFDPHRAAVARSASMGVWHQRSSMVLLVAVVAIVVLAGRSSWSREHNLAHRGFVLATSIVALVAASTALLAQRLVTWDNLALNLVASGSGISGYWYAAFDPSVSFVLADGFQMSPSLYRAILLAYLVAPVVAAFALVVVGVLLWRAPASSPEVVEFTSSDIG